MEYFKLTKNEMELMVANGLISEQEFNSILAMSLARKPEKYSRGDAVVVLTPKIFISSINFCGGENFGEPYAFLAEIFHKTSNSAFSRWWNKHMAQIAKRRVFSC